MLRKLLFVAVGIGLVITITVSSLYFFFPALFLPKISVGSDSSKYGLKIINLQSLNEFLDKKDFWKWQNEFTNYQPVQKLIIRYSDKPQPLNTENIRIKTIGSVGVNASRGILTLTIQSDPVIWQEIDKSWHLEAQLLRFVNGHSLPDNKEPDAEMFQSYQKQTPYFIELYEIEK